MNWLLLSRLLGLVGMLVGASMVFSLPWAFPVFGEATEFEAAGFWGICGAIACSLGSGSLLYLIGRKEHGTILRKEALAIVGLSWIYSGILGCLPFLFSGSMVAPNVPMTIPDALFESISGFTTTGASVLRELEDPALVPRSVLFWRSFTHCLGGMGIIVLFVAILRHLGAGGKVLMKREVPGPTSEAVRPRVRESAIVMWVIYVAFTLILSLILWLEGMSVFDAFCHSFGSMATGGFSTHNASVGYFNSWLIEFTIAVFMVIAGTNFSLYFLSLKNLRSSKDHSWKHFFAPLRNDIEYRTYLIILASATIFLTYNLLSNQIYDNLPEALRYAGFQAVSIMTTTGYGTGDFDTWNESSKMLLLLLMFVGGCAGSTAGGIKVIRFVLFAKIIWLEIEKSFRPNVVRPVRVGSANIEQGIRNDVTVYFSLVLIIFIFSSLLLTAMEPNTEWRLNKPEKLIDCTSAVVATLNNIGPGVGELGPTENYADFTLSGKVLLTVLMLLGRLELFAILVLFVPSFWKNY
ncbi:TrkH family potassium uptake protein [Gimesia maris]|uniref:TrkH family potassium uptake protein n=1 Tax=Gimesia maris TaxID=122 RepID=UPI000E81E8A3|nr:TrkH family potassium uptake protein [Gimesia maris]QDU12859.1 Trk system potassium uptake protein TrkH [Gimesia maris]HAW28262.1 potassium transporter [Planctomycetaceae bacterium]|tara:strand:+ start:3164 stop:4726 length:1563 start_codon:yes stop_codon:yes gene_type:complete